jgi:TRAP-type mannitol/chloroaromatic compound transport system permease large subunit
MVIFILIGSTCFSVVFQGVDGGAWVEHLFANIPGGWIGFLIVVNILVFFLAFFLDFFEIAFIIVPLLAPVAEKMLAPVLLEAMGGNLQAAGNAALVWFGVMLCVNMQTSFMHPPFGFALFYLRGVAPKEVKSSDIYWGALPWVGLQLIMVGLVIAFPALVTTFLDKPPPVAINSEYDFTKGQGNEGDKASPKVDEDAPVRFELEKPSR